MMVTLWFLLATMLPIAVQSHKVSRHLITEDLSMVILIADPAVGTTEGPFDGEESDYTTSSDMLDAARAGSSGVAVDRTGVLDGVPVTLNFKVYAISEESMDIGYEYEGVEVMLWQADALGVYSAFEQLQTAEQKWLRGRQVTDSNGSVTFNTILPGPYPGRALHYHIRFRLPGGSDYAATSQIAIKDSDWEQYKSIGPYTTSSSAFRSLSSDRIFNNMGPVFQDLLTLDLNGSFTTGLTAELQFGLLTTNDSLLQSNGPPVTSPTPASPVTAPVSPTSDSTPPTTLEPTVSAAQAADSTPVTMEPTLSTPVTMEPTVSTARAIDSTPVTMEPTLSATQAAASNASRIGLSIFIYWGLLFASVIIALPK